jgi:hypothetical protein
MRDGCNRTGWVPKDEKTWKHKGFSIGFIRIGQSKNFSIRTIAIPRYLMATKTELRILQLARLSLKRGRKLSVLEGCVESCIALAQTAASISSFARR